MNQGHNGLLEAEGRRSLNGQLHQQIRRKISGTESCADVTIFPFSCTNGTITREREPDKSKL